jgi:alkylresorcinol/alkylpyrone synthase
MPQPVSLVSVATALPAHRLTQTEAAAAARHGFAARYDNFDRLAKVFETSGIRTRHLVRPVEWYLQPQGWATRNAAYTEGADQLFVAAATRALDKAGIGAGQVDTIVTITSTGLATPSIDARVADRLGFRADVERVPVFGLGCAGGVTGLGLAARLAASRPGSIVLLVAVELCSVAFRLDKLAKENILASALFADGAAACAFARRGRGVGADRGIGAAHLARHAGHHGPERR